VADALAIALLEPAAAQEAELVEGLAALINRVYDDAERGLWRDRAGRTDPDELARFIAAGEIAVARRDGRIAGSVRVRQVAPDIGELGILVAAPDQRGIGVGTALLDFAERHCRERGLRAIRLELLVARAFKHPSKELLRAWYERSGYRLIDVLDVGAVYPQLPPLLATPCDLERYEKPLVTLHDAARRGSLALVEQLIRAGAIEWLPDQDGRTPLDLAREGDGPDRDAIVELLDRPVIRDPAFRAAVDAIHRGDINGLERLVDAQPRLLQERIREPDCYRDSGREQYFLDPLLLWFVANNPVLVETMPADIVEVTRALLARGAEGIDTTLGLVMTSAPARVQGHQLPLIATLLDAGATATPEAIDSALAHRELDAVLALHHPLTASIAAATGDEDSLRELLATASPDERQQAFALAVINGRTATARVALDAGADVNARGSVHSHSTALHQAALTDDVELLALLVERGARTDVRDTLWDGTPLAWARHEDRPRAAAYLERVGR
jgi:GNAT superfamily N-acetyltransferase